MTHDSSSSMWSIDTRFVKLVVFTCITVVVALTIVFLQQREFNERLEGLKLAQQDLRGIEVEATNRTREVKGIVCRIEYSMALGSSPVCMTPELLEYWSPETTPSHHIHGELDDE